MSVDVVKPPVATPWQVLAQWSKRTGFGNKVALALIALSVMAGVATYGALTAGAPFGDAHTLSLLLTLDLILFLLMTLIIARRIVALWVQQRQGTAGARLHVRLVTWFGLVAVVPAIFVTAFSIGFFYLGVEYWFSDRVRTAVDESVVVASAYLDEHKQAIRGDILQMAADLYSVPIDTREFRVAVSEQALVRNLSDAMVFDGQGRVLASTGFTFALGLDQPPPGAIEAARRGSGEVQIMTSDEQDRVTALVRLYGNTFLYVARPIDPRVLAHMNVAKAASAEYSQAEGSRSDLQIRVWLMFIVVALLVLLAAVWMGLHFARQLVQPVSALIEAAERVRAGDLSIRVNEPTDADELSVLSRTFNRMTSQLGSQRADLVEANRQLDMRRRFTETVLAGVSAGVIGLDLDGLITLANRSAAEFLEMEPGTLSGRNLAEILPEIVPILDQLGPNQTRLIQSQIELRRPGASHRTLLVRISAEQQGSLVRGYVATFDDVTELLQAQRKAAWADVARRIAHEIKNPLTPIQLSAERLKRKYLKEIHSDPETFITCTDTIVRQVGDIGRMVDEFSAFARMPQAVMRREALSDLVGQAVFLQRQAHTNMRFDVVKPAQPLVVECDGRQITQALTNLLQNAVDSIAGRIAEPGQTLPRGAIEVSLATDDRRVLIAVSDNGRGLPVAERDRLTEPYVTTRAKGTGLGLAIVKKIMEDHAGTLEMQDNPNGGARVVLCIPLEQAGNVDSTRPDRVPNPDMARDILIVDDEADIRLLISGILSDEGFTTRQAGSSDAALAALKARQPSLVILDIWLEGSRLDGMELLDEIRKHHPSVPVVMISGHGNIETAVAAIKNGAYDFIEKPFKADRLLLIIDRALEAARLKRENEELRLRAGTSTELIGISPAISRIRHEIDKVAPSGSRVLITGAPGSGKETVARLIHAQSRRVSGPFIILNCAAIRPERLEIELFGTEYALDGGGRKIGVMEQAHGGTLLLDEVGDMTLETQGKMVRSLQEQTFERVGGSTKVEVDVRVIATSTKDLNSEMSGGRFRQDLFYRLNVVPIRVPSLTERREDVPLLARQFMQRASDVGGIHAREFGDDAIAALQSYDWPGNVRQLRNVVDWLLIMNHGEHGESIRAEMLPPEIGSIAPEMVKWDRGAEIMSLPLRDARETFEREYLLAQVNRFGGNISRTAAFVGIERSALHRKLKSLGVPGQDRGDRLPNEYIVARLAYVNGRFVRHADASVHIEDRGYQFADGVYEVVTILAGAFVDEAGHMARLKRSLGELRIAMPFTENVLKLVMRELVRRNGVRDGYLYLQITRGVAPRDFKFPKSSKSAIVMTTRRQKFLPSMPNDAGVKVVSVPDIRWARRDIKSVGLLAQVLAKQAAADAGAFEAWMVDPDGFVTEGASSNAWIVTRDGVLVTHQPDRAILHGITGNSIGQLAAEAGIKIERRPFTLAEAFEAREAFLTSATTFCIAISEIDGRPIANGHPGELTRSLRQRYFEYGLTRQDRPFAWPK